METKSFPASKLNALFCWIFSSCVWSSLLPSVGKRKKIRRCLVTFHTLTLHLVLSPEYYFTEWIGWALFNQLHHPPSSKLTSLSKGCKSEVQKRRQKVGLVAGERCEVSESHEMRKTKYGYLKILSYLPSVCLLCIQ